MSRPSRILPAWPILAYSRARSAHFSLQYILLSEVARRLFGEASVGARPPFRAIRDLRASLAKLLRNDADRIARADYPVQVLRPEAPWAHAGRLPGLIADGWRICRRRLGGRTAEFIPEASARLDEVPRYYRRNFHFQTDGYLSAASAELYEHQVEMLFQGGADAMRRLLLAPMRDSFAAHLQHGGRGLRFLEIGAGTGRATRFVHLLFPKAKIVAIDLSEPYLRVAQRRLAGLPHIDTLQADGGDLPFQDAQFDAVYSVFMFHELPLAERRKVIDQARRVLKPGGAFGIVDSVQTGDDPLFDPLLKSFPIQFHEPFYRNYIAHPLEQLLERAGFKVQSRNTGFSSKVLWCHLPRRSPVKSSRVRARRDR